MNTSTPNMIPHAKYLTVYLQPALIVFGLVGNMLSLIVFLSKPMRKTSSNIYMAALSVSSFGFNLILSLQWLDEVNIPVMNKQGFCQAIVYLSYVFGFLSVWFVVCVTMENYIMTFHLSNALSHCNVRRAKIVVTLLSVYALLTYSGHFWTAGVVLIGGNISLCAEMAEYSTLNRVYIYWDMVTAFLIPAIITGVQSLAILYKTVQFCRKPGNYNYVHRITHAERILMRVTRVLLTISIAFLVLACPFQANNLRLLIARELDEDRVATRFDRILVKILQIIYYMSFSLNFVIYLLLCKNFRKGFRDQFCCNPKSHTRKLRLRM